MTGEVYKGRPSGFASGPLAPIRPLCATYKAAAFGRNKLYASFEPSVIGYLIRLALTTSPPNKSIVICKVSVVTSTKRSL